MLLKPLNKLCIKLLVHTLIGIRPLFGPANCKYLIGCTDFAIIQLQEKPLHKALWLITKRLLSCNPFA